MESERAEWSTPEEIANFFKVKISTVRLWTRQGMPHLKAGRLVRGDLRQVQSWLAERHEQADSTSCALDV